MTFTLGRVARFPPGEWTGMSAVIDEGGGGRGGGGTPVQRPYIRETMMHSTLNL